SHESVIAFFVLSGLVIATSSWKPQTTLRTYFVSRSARVLSVALPAVAGCFAAAAFIPGRAGVSVRVLAPQFLSSVFFLNGVWANYIEVPFNGPFWSLCHEVWYYGCWAVARFSSRVRTRVMLLLLAVAAMGPAFAALFGVWLMGVFAAARQAAPRRVPRALSAGLCVTTLAAVAALAGSDLQETVRAWLRADVHAWWRMRSAEYV